MLRIDKGPGHTSSEKCENYEAYVSAVTDRLVLVAMNIEAKFNLKFNQPDALNDDKNESYKTTNDSTQVENDPEQRNISPFYLL